MVERVITKIRQNENFKFNKSNTFFNALLTTKELKDNDLKVILEINSLKFESLLIHLIDDIPFDNLNIFYSIHVNKNKIKDLEWSKLNFVFFVFNPRTKVKVKVLLDSIQEKLNKEVNIRKVIFSESSKHNVSFSIEYGNDSVKENTIFEESFIDLNKYKDVKDLILRDYLSYVRGAE